jgi:hypothetical protein
MESRGFDVTLKDAIRLVRDETTQEALGFTPATLQAAYEHVTAINDEIAKAGLVDALLHGILDMAHDPRALFALAVRMGMRIQRKLDHPERVTSEFDVSANRQEAVQ